MRYLGRILVVWVFVLLPVVAVGQEPTAAEGAAQLRVMSFNMWNGGDEGGQPLEQTKAVILASKADIVGVQESRGVAEEGPRPDNAARLAEMLGWHHFDQGDNSTSILSRFPIIDATPRGWGVAVELENGKRMYVFNAHLPASPYQPYQLLDIPYGDAPFLKGEEALIEAAIAARGAQVDRLLSELRVALMSDTPVFLTGDFNEPSHLDWTEAATEADVTPLRVTYPTSKKIVEAGMHDAWRSVYPDEVAQPGWTWTPLTAEDDPEDRHDRIDFVYVAGPVAILHCEIVGERTERADIVVQPYPSDHRAVVVTVALQADTR
ncbi:MAG: endonuclease/exonuclease/phosphatase family protein [Phycisphaeraceae bacterium]